jgi:hypothetical protein
LGVKFGEQRRYLEDKGYPSRMKLKTQYALSTVFWIVTLIGGWQIAQIKKSHWLILALWVIAMTIAYIWMIKEFKARSK